MQVDIRGKWIFFMQGRQLYSSGSYLTADEKKRLVGRHPTALQTLKQKELLYRKRQKWPLILLAFWDFVGNAVWYNTNDSKAGVQNIQVIAKLWLLNCCVTLRRWLILSVLPEIKSRN